MSTYQQLLEQGDACFDEGRLAEAVHAFGQAAQLMPGEKEPLTKLGLLCKELGDLDGAADFFATVAARDTNDAFVQVQLGLVRYEQENLGEAERHLQQAVALIDQGTSRVREEMAQGQHLDNLLLGQQCAELEETAGIVRELLQEISERQAA